MALAGSSSKRSMKFGNREQIYMLKGGHIFYFEKRGMVFELTRKISLENPK